jgi:hypothetical protein
LAVFSAITLAIKVPILTTIFPAAQLSVFTTIISAIHVTIFSPIFNPIVVHIADIVPSTAAAVIAATARPAIG